MVTTVEIQGDFDKQDGETAVSGTLYFELTKRDFDGSVIVEVEPQQVALGADGTFSGVMVWPNDRGRMSSRYKVEFQPDGGKKAVIAPALFVPETGGPHELADLIFASDIAAASKVPALIPITEAQFAAKQVAGTLADGLYLVEVA